MSSIILRIVPEEFTSKKAKEASIRCLVPDFLMLLSSLKAKRCEAQREAKYVIPYATKRETMMIA